MKNLKKKGFTIVELVIVIAVIAILSAVLIPTFSNLIRKANVSADTQLVKQLNQALAVEEVENGKNVTMYDALETVKEYGFDVTKINAKANLNEILWDSKNNIFVYYDNDAQDIKYIPNSEPEDDTTDVDLWKIYNDEDDLAEQKYSIYWNKTVPFPTDVVLTVGFDAGLNNVETTLTFKGTGTVIIRTNANYNLVIDAPEATVNHYGECKTVEVKQVSANTYNVYAKVDFIQVEDGQHVVLKEGSEVNAVYAKGTNNVEVLNGQEEAIYDENDGNLEDVMAGATMFAGGLGTENDPYLIKTVEHIENIATKYDSYNYFKVADGVDVLDLSEYSYVNLNGSFDGNGVSFINCYDRLFNVAGSTNENDTAVVRIQNFSINFVAGQGVVYNCGAKSLEFNNINVSGYLLCYWNGAAFLRYGTRNCTENGFDYSVNFINCSSNAEIYSSNNSENAILVGNSYPGDGNKLTLYVDALTDENINSSLLYYTGNGKASGKKYYLMGATDLTVENIETPNNTVTNNVVKVDSNKNAVKADDGSYDLIAESDSSKVVVTLAWQYTLYTDNYEEKITDQSGVGGQLGKEIIINVENNNLDLFDKIEEIEIITDSNKFDYEFNGNKLYIYMKTSNKFVDGNLSIVTEQFVSSNNIAKYKGTLVVATNTKGAWTIK